MRAGQEWPRAAPPGAASPAGLVPRDDLVGLPGGGRRGGGPVVEAEPVEVARGEQVLHVVLLRALRPRGLLEAGRPVRALVAHDGRRVRQARWVEPRLVRPVERAADVLG